MAAPWIVGLLNRYKESEDLRYRPYKPLDQSRDKYVPMQARVERPPFDPSTYYDQLHFMRRTSDLATQQEQIRSFNRAEQERQRMLEAMQQQAIDLSNVTPQYSYQGSQGFGKAGSGSKSGLSQPLRSYSVTSNYGPRRRGNATFHSGIDLAAAQGTPIFATHDGYVTYSGWNGGHGNYVSLDSGSGLVTTYSHQAQINVKPKQYVKRGQVIGFVGSTGDSTGPHLHYEVIVNGKHVNPVGYL